MRSVSVHGRDVRDARHRRERVVDEVVGHEERRVPLRLDAPGVLGELRARARVPWR